MPLCREATNSWVKHSCTCNENIVNMKKVIAVLFLSTIVVCRIQAQNSPRYLVDSMYLADPSVHVFHGILYIYPSHDIETENHIRANGEHYNMRDYHVFSMKRIDGNVTDHGVALDLRNIPWSGRQLWAPDCACKDGKYFLYFPLKDKNDIFKIGVAVSNTPEGPFTAEKNPMMGSYSIDPAVFEDSGAYYLYFGGLEGGQLQRYRQNKAVEHGGQPDTNESALMPKVARLTDSMLEFAEEPKDVAILDSLGNPLKTGDHARRFFEGAWLHKYHGKYYFSYSTGDTHLICYAVGDNPYGPFTYQGVLLSPVVGWTTHHSIVEFNNQWYLFYHDCKPSGGVNYLRSLKVRELEHTPDGTIQYMNGKD
jgi:hypothetical protein